jgi:hypothetical protein
MPEKHTVAAHISRTATIRMSRGERPAFAGSTAGPAAGAT